MMKFLLLLAATILVAANKIAILPDFKSRILVVGDGDLSFSRFLAEYFDHHESILATTMDTPELLYSSFKKAKENVDVISRCDRSNVQFCIDATKLEFHYFQSQFDVIIWNFPHVVGKQNIKRNRELICHFLASASRILSSNGSIKISLCEKQCGTRSRNRLDWDRSWKLSAQVAEAGLLLSHCDNFNPCEYVGYTPIGHRGHGGAFLTGSSHLFSITKPGGVAKGYQCPIHTHEVHMLTDMMVPDILDFENRVREVVSEMLLTTFAVTDGLWSVHMVDLYICPRTGDFCHTIQIAYGSTTAAIGRSMADSIRLLVERDICEKMQMRARQEKHGGKVSRPYPWYVAEALKKARSVQEEEVLRRNRETVSRNRTFNQPPPSSSDEVGKKLADMERELDASRDRVRAAADSISSHSNNSYYDSEMLRGLARQLWTYRASVLSLGASIEDH